MSKRPGAGMDTRSAPTPCASSRAAISAAISTSDPVASRITRRGPAFGGLDRVGGAIDRKVRDQPQRLQMLDRLVRRTILAQPDRIMRHDIDDARVLQR